MSVNNFINQITDLILINLEEQFINHLRKTIIIRLDLPIYCLDQLDDLANYCYATSYWSGIPLAIMKADEEVKISRQFIGEIYRDIIRRLNSNNGEVSHLAPIWGESKWMGV